jgi:hypothetical protein
LLIADLALTVTGTASLFACSGCDATAAAVRTTIRTRDTNTCFRTLNRLFETDLQVVAQVGTATRTISTAATTKNITEAEEILENAPTEYIRELSENILVEYGSTFEPGMTILIVGGTFFWVSQNTVRFSSLFEGFFRFFVTRVLIWMVFDG